MPADGTTTTGKDGIIAILALSDIADEAAGPDATEIASALEMAMMTDWSLTANAQFQTQNTQCMLSNSDGGSNAATNWDEQELTGKSFTLDVTTFWQKTAAGDPLYKGYCKIASVTPTASTSTKVTQTAQLTGDGELESGTVPA